MQENTTPLTDEEIINICLDAFKTKSSCEYDYAILRYTGIVKPFVKVIRDNANFDFSEDIFECVDAEPEYPDTQIIIINKSNNKDFIENVNTFFADELTKRHEFASDSFRAYAFIFFEREQKKSTYDIVPFRTFMVAYPESPCRGSILKDGDEGYEDALSAYISFCHNMNHSADRDYAVFEFPYNAHKFIDSVVEGWENGERILRGYGFSFCYMNKFYIVNTNRQSDFFEKMENLYSAFYYTRVGEFGEYAKPGSGKYDPVCRRGFFPTF